MIRAESATHWAGPAFLVGYAAGTSTWPVLPSANSLGQSPGHESHIFGPPRPD